MSNNNLGLFRKYLNISAKINPEVLNKTMAALETVKGWLLPNQFYLMHSIGLTLSGRIVEIGSYHGKSMCLWALTTDPDATDLHSVDPYVWGEEKYLENLKDNLNKFGFLHRVNFHQGKSSEVVNNFEDNSIDFLYVDGDHSEEGVKEDILLWYNKLKSGALIIGHDYPSNFGEGFDGLKTSVDKYVKNSPAFRDFGSFAGIWGAYKK